MHSQGAQCLLLTSFVDTSPNVVTEAHAAGVPVVATCEGGVPDMVRDGVDGFVVDLDDDRAIKERLERLVGRPGVCRELGMAGRARVAVEHEPALIARRHVEFYRTILARHGARERKRRKGG